MKVSIPAHGLEDGNLQSCTLGQASHEPHTRRTNLEMTTRSPPTSRASSLNDSLSSQLSQLRPDATGDLELIRPHGVMTPLTSLSKKSSHEATDRPYLEEPDVSLVEQDGNIDGLLTYDVVDKDNTSAPKRMANGEVKPSESSPSTSPVKSSQYGHSRNSSTTSRGSQIGEVRHLSQYGHCRHT